MFIFVIVLLVWLFFCGATQLDNGDQESILSPAKHPPVEKVFEEVMFLINYREVDAYYSNRS